MAPAGVAGDWWILLLAELIVRTRPEGDIQ
jgi:hypothetical protein